MKVTTTIVSFALIAVVFRLVRKNLLYTRYTLWWTFIIICSAVLGLYPRLSDWMAKMLGIAYPPALILLLACVFIFIKMLAMDIERSNQEIRLRRLTQRVAMLERMCGFDASCMEDEEE
nr:DUF2304 domain-containing protein [Desulfobaculum xiamenense]